MANVRRSFQPSRAGRRIARLAALVVVVAALVALTFAPSSLLRPQTASAQCNGNYSGGTYYNGTYDPYNMGCSYSGGNFCNGYTTGV